MKKMFTLFVALIGFNALFAQFNSGFANDYNARKTARSGNDHYYNNNDYDRTGRAVVITKDRDYYPANNRYTDKQKREEIERINRDYDRRIDVYKNDRRMNNYERERQVSILQKERNDKLKAFGGGVLLGGIIGLLISSHM